MTKKIDLEGTISVQKVWFKTLTDLVKKVNAELDAMDDTVRYRQMPDHLYHLLGYASSAENLLKMLSEEPKQ